MTAFWILAAVGLALRAAVLLLPLDPLVQRVVPDDAFLYLQTARHLAQGHGSTFDGLTVTNGYHPLWMALLVPIFLAADGETAVRVSLVLCMLLELGSFFLLTRLAERLTGSRTWALVPGLLWWLNPMALREGMNGMETALVTCLSLGLLVLYERGARPAALGAVAGLCLLARTDSVFLVGVLLLHMALVRRRFAEAVTAGLAASALLLPFLAWNQAVFGSPVQASATAYPMVVSEHHAAQHGAALAASLRKSGELLWATFVEFPPRMTGLGFLLPVLLLGAAWAGARDAGTRRALGFLLLPTAALAALAAYHAGLRWFPRRWYFFMLVPLVSLYGAVLLAWLASTGRRAVAVGLLALCALRLVWTGVTLSGRPDAGYPWQGEMLQAARWLRANVPPEDRVGSFNAGILAYFSDRTVVNLDGLANHEALQALQARRLASYVAEARLRWLADFEYSVRQDYRPFYGGELRLAEATEIDLPDVDWQGSRYRIWRVD